MHTLGQKATPRVLVIVPAHNEAASIGSVLRNLSIHTPMADVAVVDDGSVDGTGRIAAAAGAQVLCLPLNLGVGAAMQTGYVYACERGYDIAVQFDGDGQHRADQVGLLVAEVAEHGADLVIGSRLVGRRRYRFPLSRWIGSRILARLVFLTTGVRVCDPTSGFRAASRRMLSFFARHYPQSYLADTVEALVTAARHGMVIRELPARMRRNGHSSIGNAAGLWHTLRICLAVLIDRMERKLPVEPLAALQGREKDT